MKKDNHAIKDKRKHKTGSHQNQKSIWPRLEIIIVVESGDHVLFYFCSGSQAGRPYNQISLWDLNNLFIHHCQNISATGW